MNSKKPLDEKIKAFNKRDFIHQQTKGYIYGEINKIAVQANITKVEWEIAEELADENMKNKVKKAMKDQKIRKKVLERKNRELIKEDEKLEEERTALKKEIDERDTDEELKTLNEKK